MKHLSALALVIAIAICSSGCGYALAGRGSFLPADIRVVGIPPLENRTTTARIEQIFTEKIRTEFIDRNKYTIQPVAGGADAVLSGAVTAISYQPVGLTNQQQQASRYLFIVTMRVQFTDARNNDILWSNDALTFREEYDLSRGGTQLEGAVLLEQEGPAIDRLATDLARTVVSAILEAF
ncbi:MAG TPA: LPS assembly lipoprotein LptE [Thermoanaerobaculia bacterium]